jgi:pimeloyl-ACP methyl ester carboxylesterase
LWLVAPDLSDKPWAAPAAPGDKARAVVLIPGLHVHPLRPARVAKAERRPWQEPKSELVKALAKDFDVFAFSYAQTVPVDDVSQAAGLRDALARIRKAGYTDIVLVGHSAGGLIARQFVERNPDAGVTKVVAVAAPFAGSDLATLKLGYPRVQAPFVQSLAPEARKAAAGSNPRALGKGVGFACLVCKLKRVETDGVVLAKSQWPDDLQALGVPAALVTVSHFEAMQGAASVKAIAELAREKLARWSPEEVEQARRALFAEIRKKD